jgi:hypothetical protein
MWLSLIRHCCKKTNGGGGINYVFLFTPIHGSVYQLAMYYPEILFDGFKKQLKTIAGH